ncbi:N-6 DNA methylase (plasmid) [Halorientalis sp. IM1011]|uniref:type I restriction-modification system subunit M n=1 Tax=Halorientalis sp. IM1011 TaxID=1932360 RepID=UPI00097CCC4C|nr:class I SAM-dependent DNA methyltransferase [Halorientalis sp. IM1011]AQL44745.1 N-6 DNA methylase [Halorientalis sp. IM1011]
MSKITSYTDSITLEELENHLFECADIIRNTVDKTDYKDYILPMVFYKTLNDTYEDQREDVLEEFGDEEIADDPSFYDFPIPEGYQWADLLDTNKNVDEFLNEAFEAIERENPELQDAFRADYVSADALDDDRLKDLAHHLDTYNLSAERVPPDTLGEAYMDLVKHFASEEGKEGGEYFTPPNIVQMMVRLLSPVEPGDSIHDPTCGSAGMLVEAARYFREEQGGDPTKLTLTGQEMNPDIAAIAKMNLFIHRYEGEIAREDSLRNPQFTTGKGQLQTFDYVLANFPFSADWAKDHLQDDKFGRFDWADKLPRADRGDYAFIMHMEEQLNETGQAAIVVPHGVLFRKHERRYREPMIKRDIIEAVVGLPENLFQNNSIPSAVLVLNEDKPDKRADEIQFIHAADEDFYRELSNQNELTEDGLDHIVKNFDEWRTEERVSRTVPLEEIRENDYNLNIALYVDTTEPEDYIDVNKELDELRKLQAEREEIEAKMTQHMEALNYE